jgi:ActR/RegA family two-component response regulator
VIYLQGATGAFGRHERERIETFAIALTKVADHLRAYPRRPTLHEEVEALTSLRVYGAIARCGNNLTKAAHELGVTRPLLYRALRKRAVTGGSD